MSTLVLSQLPANDPRIGSDKAGFRTFEPFTTVELMVFTRMNAMNPNGTYRPFSCRLRTKYTLHYVTVLGVTMPDKGDNVSEPSLRMLTASDYHELEHKRELRLDLAYRMRELIDNLNEADYYTLLRLERILILGFIV